MIDFLGDTVMATHLSIVAMRREVSPGRSGLEQARAKLRDEATASGRNTRIAENDRRARGTAVVDKQGPIRPGQPRSA
ncbi:hypothetical protein [Corynebacterium atrinae]|uniref:hypothetical protein n=1 Tax=Corynebacterium atrinae TaxID=1336740 RepID=UPI0025B4285B|nr:hypothetical protein [Corynebacterium atrinae]